MQRGGGTRTATETGRLHVADLTAGAAGGRNPYPGTCADAMALAVASSALLSRSSSAAPSEHGSSLSRNTGDLHVADLAPDVQHDGRRRAGRRVLRLQNTPY